MVKKVSRIKIYYTEEADKLNLVYEDNGIGISDYTRQNLFKEGYGKGTGYGLYLTAKLCKCTGRKSMKQANMEKEPNLL